MSPLIAVPRGHARGVVDPDTGSVLALTGRSVIRLTNGRLADLTPEHEWTFAAAGGGAVAIAGGGRLTWTDGGTIRCVPADEVYRGAVQGATAAGVTEDGTVTVWTGLDQAEPAEPLRATFAGAPDGVALATELDRLAVWGWPASGPAVLSVFTLHPPVLAQLPARNWPEPAAGVAFPLAEEAVAVATADGIVVLDREGETVATHPVEGLERVAGRGSTLAWIRSTRRRVTPLVGIGHLTGHALQDVVEDRLPGPDRFPELAVVGHAALLVAGAGPDRLIVHRLGHDGWAPPRQHVLTPTATSR